MNFTNISIRPNGRYIYANCLVFAHILKQNKGTLDAELNNTKTKSNTKNYAKKWGKHMKEMIN